MIKPLTLLAILGCFPASADPAPLEASPWDGTVAAVTAALLEYQHYEGEPLDDKLAQEWLAEYLDALDPGRYYFLASDVAEFAALAPLLDDELRARTPRISTALLIFRRYQDRVRERMASAQEILKRDMDLTTDEVWRYDRSEEPWPVTPAEADEIWRLRIKDDMVRGELAGRSVEDTRTLLSKRFQRMLTDNEAQESGDVLELWLTALGKCYDPHTAYFKPATSDDFDIDLSNSLEGIGAELRTEGEYTVVVRLVPGGPAERDGTLQPKDKIIAVAQGNEPPVDVVDLRIDRVVKLIRGPKETEVRLTVLPADAADPSHTEVISIVRDQVILADSDAELELREVRSGGRTHTLAVIDLPSFYLDLQGRMAGDPEYRSASRDVERILRTELPEGGVDAVVLDLRHNGGGSLSEAVDLTGLFIDRGPVVQIRERDGRKQTLRDKAAGMAWSGPMAVLTSPLSASASEILAGAVQDYGRGLVVGSRSHGKGTVQTLIDIQDAVRRARGRTPPPEVRGALKITTQKFYRVSGSSTQEHGVNPDVVVPSLWDGLDVYESDLDKALPWDTIEPVPHKRVADLSGVFEALQAQSTQRVRASEDFLEIADVARERAALKKDGVPLNLEARKALLDRDEEEEADEAEEEAEPVDFILGEQLQVVGDWLAGSTPS